ncbi:hypothetical protein SprV_0301318300 [Sparganum proliferum]
MRSLVGNMAIDDKSFKQIFLVRLSTSVQTILASDSDDLDIIKLAEMADPVMEVERLSSTTVAQVSQPLTAFTSDLAGLQIQIVQLSANVAASQLRRSAGPSRRSFGRDRRRSRSRPRTANLCWHFRYLLEGRQFTIFTDNKPLTFALHSHSGKPNPGEIRHLDFISQFTSDIRHIDRSLNEVADALFRPSIAHFQLSPGIDLAEMAAEQRRVGSPCDEDVSGLEHQELPLTTGNSTILRDVSPPFHRQFVPPYLRHTVYSSLHNLSYPGSRATDKLVSNRVVWPGMHKDLKAWTRLVSPVNGLKTSLRAEYDPENWTDHLLLVLLGIRSALKSDLDCSAAGLVFGATVRLPVEMISPTPRGAVEDPTNFLHRLRQSMLTLRFRPGPPSLRLISRRT